MVWVLSRGGSPVRPCQRLKASVRGLCKPSVWDCCAYVKFLQKTWRLFDFAQLLVIAVQPFPTRAGKSVEYRTLFAILWHRIQNRTLGKPCSLFLVAQSASLRNQCQMLRMKAVTEKFRAMCRADFSAGFPGVVCQRFQGLPMRSKKSCRDVRLGNLADGNGVASTGSLRAGS